MASSIFRQLFLANRGHIGKNSEISDLASKSFSNIPISAVNCATLALSPEMLVSSVEILTLSAAICSSEVIWIALQLVVKIFVFLQIVAQNF